MWSDVHLDVKEALQGSSTIQNFFDLGMMWDRRQSAEDSYQSVFLLLLPDIWLQNRRPLWNFLQSNNPKLVLNVIADDEHLFVIDNLPILQVLSTTQI